MGETFNKTVDNVKEFFDIAGKKTGEFIDVQRLRIDRAGTNGKLSRANEELGNKIFENRAAGLPDAEGTTDLFALIAALREELRSLDLKISARRGVRPCPVCGAENERTAAFCNRCGQKLVFSEPSAATPPAEEEASAE